MPVGRNCLGPNTAAGSRFPDQSAGKAAKATGRLGPWLRPGERMDRHGAPAHHRERAVVRLIHLQPYDLA